MFLFFPWSNLKVGAVHSSDSSLFRKRSIMCQLNVQATTGENEDQRTLSNIIFIAFQNSYSFLWIEFWIFLLTKLLIDRLQIYQKSTPFNIFKGFRSDL